MNALTREKSYPENYPSDAMAILDTMSFSRGKSLKLMGSMALRSQQYAGDYDGYEVVELHEKSDATALKHLARRFQEIIKELRGMKNVFIGDCKAGSVEEWRVIPKSAKVIDGRVQGFDKTRSLAIVDTLKAKKVITPQEAKDTSELLNDATSPEKFLIAKGTIKFHIVRWKVPEILEGAKHLRDGSTMTLEEAFNCPTITKLDTIGMVQNNRYTDFSVIYEFKNNGKILNPDVIDINTSLKENILLYTHERNFFKVLKRRFALAKMEHDTATLERLQPILNGDLGRIYQLASDIGTLITLLSDFKVGKEDLKNVRFELDQMRGRLANVYALDDALKAEHGIIGELNSALKAPRADLILAKLERIDATLQKLLSENTPTLKGGVIVIENDPAFYEETDGKTPDERVKYANEMEKIFRDLAHFFQARNPAMALGYRALADDIYMGVGCLTKDAETNVDRDGHGYSTDGTCAKATDTGKIDSFGNKVFLLDGRRPLDKGHRTAQLDAVDLMLGKEGRKSKIKPLFKPEQIQELIKKAPAKVRADAAFAKAQPALHAQISKLSDEEIRKWLETTARQYGIGITA